MKLSEVKLGETVKVVAVSGRAPKKRLQSIGITRGSVLRVEMFAPLNGALYVRLGQAGIVMRREIAEAIEAERVEETSSRSAEGDKK